LYVFVVLKVESATIFSCYSRGFLMIEPFLQTNNPLCIKCNAEMRFSSKEAESSGFVHDVFECPKCRSTQRTSFLFSLNVSNALCGTRRAATFSVLLREKAILEATPMSFVSLNGSKIWRGIDALTRAVTPNQSRILQRVIRYRNGLPALRPPFPR
jgi:hypothetical protein